MVSGPDTAEPQAQSSREGVEVTMRQWNRRRIVAASLTAGLSCLGSTAAARASLDGVPWDGGSGVARPVGDSVKADGHGYAAYTSAALKYGQFAQYSCEFDAAWVILKTFGIDVDLEEQVAIIGIDSRIEPYPQQTPAGIIVYGGDITTMFSGDYTSSYLARTTGKAMRKVFDHYQLDVEPVGDRAGIETALDRGALVWMKATVDFLPWEPITWTTPEGQQLPGVLGNDHAVVAMGYNDDTVVIRDVLGPTSSNWERAYEYDVPWDTFLTVWEAQGFDGLAVAG